MNNKPRPIILHKLLYNNKFDFKYNGIRNISTIISLYGPHSWNVATVIFDYLMFLDQVNMYITRSGVYSIYISLF